MVFILFVQVLKKVLKSLKCELKNPAATLSFIIGSYMLLFRLISSRTDCQASESEVWLSNL